MPEVVNTNQGASNEDMQRLRKQQYNVKRNTFKNLTFTIKQDSFKLNYSNGEPIMISFGEFDTLDDMFELMTRNIIENGGKVLASDNGGAVRSNYIIMDDGSDPKIWDKLGQGSMVDQLNRKIINYRWVEHCIQRGQHEEDSDKMHLLPLPVKVPLPAFRAATVTLTLFEKSDREVFEFLVGLYGFSRNPDERNKPHHSTHIVLHKVDKLTQSATLKTLSVIKTARQMPKVVTLDWLIDCMMTGQLLPCDEPQYQVDMSKVSFK
jgi:hypothetical protein